MDKKIWTGDILKEVASRAGVSREAAAAVVSAFLYVWSQRLAEGRSIAFKNIGTFSLSEDRLAPHLRWIEFKPCEALITKLNLFRILAR